MLWEESCSRLLVQDNATLPVWMTYRIGRKLYILEKVVPVSDK